MHGQSLAAVRSNRRIWYGLILVAVIIGFIVYYRSSIASRRRVVLSAAADALSITASDLGSRLENWKGVVGRAVADNGINGPEGLQGFQLYLRVLVPGLEAAGDCETAAGSLEPDPTGAVKLILLPREHFSLFFYQDHSHCAVSEPQTVDEFFRRLPEQGFANVLLASRDGQVFYQTSSSGPRITNVDDLISAAQQSPQEDRSVTEVVTSWFSNSDSSGARPAAAERNALNEAIRQSIFKKTAQSTAFSNILPVKVGGEPFLLVVEPVPFVKIDNRDKTGTRDLILAGLMSEADVDRRSKAWPKSVAAWLILILVIAYSGRYSFSNFRMKPPLQPVRVRDIVSVTVSGLIFCSAVTLAIIQACATWNPSAEEQKLHALAAQIHDNMRDELCRLYQSLQSLSRTDELAQAVQSHVKSIEGGKSAEDRRCRFIINLLGPQPSGANSCVAATGNPSARAIAYSYPFFDYVTWSTYNGDVLNGQVAKWSIRQQLTPPTQMTQFDWFFSVREKHLYRIHADTQEERALLGGAYGDVYVGPVRSPNTGDYNTVVAKPIDTATETEGLIVGTIAAPMFSLNSPVFPAGYAFAVLGPDGTVLYSSDQRRNLRENFFQEADANEKLSRAVQTRSKQSMELTLGGDTSLAYILPLDDVLEGPQWSVVVYRTPGLDQQIQLEVFMQAMKLSVPHVVEMLLLVLALWGFKKFHPSWRLFPIAAKRLNYLVLIIFILVTIIFTWFSLRTATPGARFWITLVTPGIWVAIGIWFLVYFEDVRQGMFRLPARLLQLWAARVGKLKFAVFLYSCALCSGLVLLAILPATQYYKIAFQMVHASVAAEDLVVNTRALENRARLVSEYYDQILLPLADNPRPSSADDGGASKEAEAMERRRFIADRLNVSLDVYRSEDSAPASITLDPSAHRASFLDRGFYQAARLQLFALRSAPSISDGMVTKRQIFQLERWPFVQFDYRGQYIPAPVAPGTSDIWMIHREAALVPDLSGDTNYYLWACLFVLSVLMCWAIYAMLRGLFFVNFAHTHWKPIRIQDLPNVNRNILLLRVEGTPVKEALQQLPDDSPALSYIDLLHLDSPRALAGLSLAPDAPVFVDNFDFSFDSEETAKRNLAILQDLLFSAHRRVILAASKDPADYLDQLLAGSRTQGAPAAWLQDLEEPWKRVFGRFDYRRLPVERGATSLLSLARRVYASCTDDQCAALYQIAQGKWVNSSNEQAIHALIARHWIKVRPEPALTPEVAFLAKATKWNPALPGAERLADWKAAAAGSEGLSVGTLTAIFAVVALSVAGKDLLQSGAGALTGLLAGIPSLVRIFSSLRNVAAAPAVKDGSDA